MIGEDDGSRDIPFWPQMHVDKQDEVVLAAQQRRRHKPRCVGGSWLHVTRRPHIFIEEACLGLQHPITD
jgi:hypothetical protein